MSNILPFFGLELYSIYITVIYFVNSFFLKVKIDRFELHYINKKKVIDPNILYLGTKVFHTIRFCSKL